MYIVCGTYVTREWYLVSPFQPLILFREVQHWLWVIVVEPNGNEVCLCFHLEPKSHTLDVTIKWEQQVHLNPDGNLMFLSVVLMIDPRTLSSEPLLPSRFIFSRPFLPTDPLQRYYLHHHYDSYIYWHRHYIFYILPQV